MKTSDKTLCVVGASGLVGSNIVKAGLDRGYTVHGTMRDKDAPSKAPFLNALTGASERLSLFQRRHGQGRMLLMKPWRASTVFLLPV